jgi:alpha-L-fucosidase
MYIQGSQEFEHHVATYGPHTEFGYKDFIPQLTAANFDADAWAALFEQTGARFVVPVAEHHDGFQMYDSALSEWNAARMGPKRDIVGELAAATRKHGMVFGLSSHRAEHWFFFNGGTRFESDVQNPRYAGLYGPAQLAPTDFHDPQSSTRPSQEFLDDWLALNGEAIYGTRPWKVFGEGPTEVSEGAFTDTKCAAFTGEDIRFTTKGDTLYAIALAWPGERLTIKSLGTAAGLLGGEVSSVELLGHAEPLIWERGEHGLTIALPEQLPCQHAFTFKIIGR